MREMTDGTTKLQVTQHIMLRNMWEYYVCDVDEDIAFALVVGDATEMGNVSLSEIEPHIISQTGILTDLMPAPGWSWVE